MCLPDDKVGAVDIAILISIGHDGATCGREVGLPTNKVGAIHVGVAIEVTRFADASDPETIRTEPTKESISMDTAR